VVAGRSRWKDGAVPSGTVLYRLSMIVVIVTGFVWEGGLGRCRDNGTI
jgi:hypothetical protein